MSSRKLFALTLSSLLIAAACGDDDTTPSDGGREMKKDGAVSEDSGPAGETDSGGEVVDGG
jgi:hypothetical protein